jgi:hypothetical protein
MKTPDHATAPTSPTARAYTVAEVATKTGYSRQTITRLFEDEKGVIIINRPEQLHKRGYGGTAGC